MADINTAKTGSFTEVLSVEVGAVWSIPLA